MTLQPLRPYLWMLSGSLAFAVMSTLAHAVAASCDWQVVALARSSLACLFAALLARGAGVRLVLWRPRTLWLRSIAGSLSLVCTFFALARLPVSDVLTLTNTFPLWVAVLSWPLLGEVPTGGVWACVAGGVAGVTLIQQPHFAAGNFATVLALVASVFTAVAMIGLHRLRGLDLRAIVAHFSGVSVVFCLASLFLFDRDATLPPVPGGDAVLMLLGVGVAATVGQLCLTKAFGAGRPAKVAVVGLTQIVFAMLLEIVLWRRSFNALTLLGMALVAAPTAWLLTHRLRSAGRTGSELDADAVREDEVSAVEASSP